MQKLRTPLLANAIYLVLLGIATLAPSLTRSVFGYDVKDPGVSPRAIGNLSRLWRGGVGDRERRREARWPRPIPGHRPCDRLGLFDLGPGKKPIYSSSRARSFDHQHCPRSVDLVNQAKSGCLMMPEPHNEFPGEVR